MKKLLSTFTFILLTSSASYASDKIVSIKEVYTKNAGMIECTGYDAASDSCLTTATSTLKDNAISTSNTFLLSPEPRITVTMNDMLQIKGDVGCTDFSSLEIAIDGTDDKNMINTITGAMKASLSGIDASCVSLVANDDGTYTARTFDSNDKAIPGQPDMIVTFFKDKKELRIPQ